MPSEKDLRNPWRQSIVDHLKDNPFSSKSSYDILCDIAPEWGVDPKAILTEPNHQFRFIVDLALSDLIKDGVVTIIPPWFEGGPDGQLVSEFQIADPEGTTCI